MIEGADTFLQDENPMEEHLDELEADAEARRMTLGIPERELKAFPTIKRAITNIIGDGETFLINLAFDEKKND
jgi:hypothetical protein